MRNISAIMRRELLSLFCSPIAYIVIAGFLVFTGVLMWLGFSPGKPATLRDVVIWTPWVLAIIIPAVSMRAISEEYRSGTIESLMTAPVSELQLVIGKHFASLVFYVIMLAPTLVYVALMEAYGNPDWGASLTSYLGLLLIGMMFTAFGLCASSLTKNQVVAWILGAVPLLLFACMGYFLVDRASGWGRVILQQLNVFRRLDEFSRGLITTDGVVFFLATAILFLFLAVKVVESRRWR